MPALSRSVIMTAAPRRPVPQRIRLSHVEWVEQRLSPRDWQIIETVNRLRLVSTIQLDRIHFFTLHGRSRAVARGRAVRRLVAWRVLAALPRRVGGANHGSAAVVLALDSTGRRLLAQRQAGGGIRYGGLPGERTVAHTLAVSELYASLVELAREHRAAAVAAYEAEPASWWPNGFGGYVKPDAYALLTAGALRYHWWIEVDKATESMPTLRRKALAYLDFYQSGQLGPGGIVPRVVFSVPSEQRLMAVRQMVAALPEPASELFLVTVDRETVFALLSALKE
jgi:hypothetical protein